MSTLNELKYNVYNRFSGRKNLSYDDLRKAYPGEKNDAAKAIALFGLPENQAMYQWLNPINDGFDLLEKLGDRASVFIPGAMEPDGSHSVPGASLNPTVDTQVLGPNLVNNGDFSGGATGWILQQPTAGTVAIESGGMRVRTTDGTIAYFQRGDLVLPISSTYRITFTVRGWVNGRIAVTTDGSSNAYVSPAAAGTYSFDTAMTPLSVLQFKRPGGENCDLIVDDISCQLITTMPQAPWLMDYVESTMNTPAAVDGPVGALTDGSGVEGPNLVPNSGGPFTSANSWTANNSGTVTLADGMLTVTNSTAVYGGAVATISTVPGKRYWIEFSAFIKSGVLSWLLVGDALGGNTLGLIQLPTALPNKPLTWSFVATSATTYLTFQNNNVAGYALSVSSIVVRALSGRHATQGTGANKPTLRRGFVMLSTQSGTLNTSPWSTTFASVSSGQQGPTGAADAYGILDTGDNGSHLLQGMSYTFAAGRTYTMLAVAKAGGSNFVHIPFYASAFGTAWATIDLANGTISQSTNLIQSSVAPAGNGYFLISLSATCTTSSGGPGCYFWLTPSGTAGYAPSYTGTGTVRIYARAGGVSEGVVTAQQALACGGIPLTTTIAASSALGNYALEFDGSAKQLILPSAPYQGTDDHTVIVGATLATSGAYSSVFGAGGNGAQRWGHVGFENTGKPYGQWQDDAAVNVSFINAAPLVNTPVVLQARQVGQTRSFVVNDTQIGSNTTPLGAVSIVPPKIGAAASGSSDYFKGLIYLIVVIRGTLTETEARVLRRFVAALTGPTGITI